MITTRHTDPNPINHPEHYNQHPSGVECIDIIEHFNYNLGAAVKYIWRAGLKSSDKLEDLKKASWYVDKEIQRLMKEEPTQKQVVPESVYPIHPNLPKAYEISHMTSLENQETTLTTSGPRTNKPYNKNPKKR